MHDRSRLDGPDQVIDPTTVAHVEFVVNKIWVATYETLLIQRVSPAAPKKLARMLLSTP